MLYNNMEFFLDNDVVALYSQRPGEEHPRFTQNLFRPGEQNMFIRISDLYDESQKGEIIDKLYVLFDQHEVVPAQRQSGGDRRLKGAEELYKILCKTYLTAYRDRDPNSTDEDSVDYHLPFKKLQKAERDREKAFEKAKNDKVNLHEHYQQIFDEQFSRLPFRVKAAAYNWVNAFFCFPPEQGSEKSQLGSARGAAHSEKGLVYIDHTGLHPDTICEEIIHAVDGNCLFAGGDYSGQNLMDGERFTDQRYWKKAVDDDLKQLKTNPVAQKLIGQYREYRKGKSNSFFDRKDYREALADFACMELMLYQQLLPEEKGKVFGKVQQAMSQAFLNMSRAYYPLEFDKPPDKTRNGEDFRLYVKPEGEERSLVARPDGEVYLEILPPDTERQPQLPAGHKRVMTFQDAVVKGYYEDLERPVFSKKHKNWIDESDPLYQHYYRFKGGANVWRYT